MFTIVALDDDDDIQALCELTPAVVHGLCQSILEISYHRRDFESLEIGKSIEGVENGEQKSYVARLPEFKPVLNFHFFDQIFAASKSSQEEEKSTELSDEGVSAVEIGGKLRSNLTVELEHSQESDRHLSIAPKVRPSDGVVLT